METATETGKDAAIAQGRAISTPEIPSGFILNKKTVSVVMRVGEAKLIHTFVRPTLNNWSDYLRNLQSGFILSDSKGWAATSDEAFAAKELWNELVVGVSGYRGAEGDDWKKKIPVSHKQTGVRYLQDVWVSETQSGGDKKDDDGNLVFDLEADTRTVVLAGTSDGFSFDRLVHVVNVPNAEQEIKFQRLRVHYVRQTGDSNKVTSPPRLRKMAELYDELIQSVEGYEAIKLVPPVSENPKGNIPIVEKAVPITEAVDAKRHMDVLHKQAVVLAVFSEQPVGERAGADSGRVTNVEAEEDEG